MPRVYDNISWDEARERTLARDGRQCTVARLIGGTCSPTLDVHHLTPVSQGGEPYTDENLISVCHLHHPRLEALRRHLLAERGYRRCTHRHPYPGGREECERRLNRQVAA